MPHTSHKKKTQRYRRIEVTDEAGWTRITTNDRRQRQPQLLRAQKNLDLQYGHIHQSYAPAPCPEDMTVAQLEHQFRCVEDKWLASASYRDLEECLGVAVDAKVLKNIDKCLVFGTGSFSGLTHGWIERFAVSQVQLAAFLSVVSIVEKRNGSRPSVYAQEPVYNQLDRDLLSRLGIITLTSPAGFEVVGPQSFVYTPNAELNITLRALAANPSIAMVSGQLDSYWRNERGEACTNRALGRTRGIDNNEHSDTDSASSATRHDPYEDNRPANDDTEQLRDEIEEGLAIEEGFKQDKDVRRLASLDVKDEPFFNVHVYFRRAADGEDRFDRSRQQPIV